MPDASRIAAAIDLRVRQLEARGITGIALANHMIVHMQDLRRAGVPRYGTCCPFSS